MHTSQGVGSLTVKTKTKTKNTCTTDRVSTWPATKGSSERGQWEFGRKPTRAQRLTGTLPILAVDTCLN